MVWAKAPCLLLLMVWVIKFKVNLESTSIALNAQQARATDKAREKWIFLKIPEIPSLKPIFRSATTSSCVKVIPIFLNIPEIPGLKPIYTPIKNRFFHACHLIPAAAKFLSIALDYFSDAIDWRSK